MYKVMIFFFKSPVTIAYYSVSDRWLWSRVAWQLVGKPEYF